MALRTYSCACGESFDFLSGLQVAGGNDSPICPSCQGQCVTEVIGGGQLEMKGFDYSKMTPNERAMAISNRKKMEAKAEQFLSGEESPMIVPKGIPKEFVPQVPDRLRKSYF